MTKLTPRQEEIFTFVVRSIELGGIAPTIRDIGLAFGIGSLRGATCHLDRRCREVTP